MMFRGTITSVLLRSIPISGTILSSFDKSLRIMNEEPTVRVLRQCYTLISSTKRGTFNPLGFGLRQ
jgi:hypothetical protein